MTAESAIPAPATVLDAIVASLLHAARFTPNDQVQPAVTLWTDHDRQWDATQQFLDWLKQLQLG